MYTSSGKLESRFRVFGQACHLVVGLGSGTTDETLTIAEQEFRRIESKFDSFSPGSLIGLINQRAGSGKFTPLDAESRSLFHYVQTLWSESKHLFDPTACLLQQFYSEMQDQSHFELQSDLPLVGWSRLDVSEQGAHLEEPGMRLDFNSCIRPYAVDRVRKLLLKSGVKNALVDLDTDVATIGKQADGANWLVGTRYPDGLRTAIERFKLNNKGYAIRGDFENSLVINGERFSRLFSPIDGQPIPGLLGVAVIADTCLTACSAASVARLKTEKNALKWLENLGLPWLGIDRNLKCHGPMLDNAR
jgi:thiamine biosynthesis lipoprotein